MVKKFEQKITGAAKIDEEKKPTGEDSSTGAIVDADKIMPAEEKGSRGAAKIIPGAEKFNRESLFGKADDSLEENIEMLRKLNLSEEKLWEYLESLGSLESKDFEKDDTRAIAILLEEKIMQISDTEIRNKKMKDLKNLGIELQEIFKQKKAELDETTSDPATLEVESTIAGPEDADEMEEQLQDKITAILPLNLSEKHSEALFSNIWEAVNNEDNNTFLATISDIVEDTDLDQDEKESLVTQITTFVTTAAPKK